ncbi:MAG TPA: YdcF family protein [Vicinamibacterales bacterium]|nr:YdcF family protein [Vicinamibacterales bacterium]
MLDLAELFVPGGVPFLVLSLIFGTLLLYRRKDGGRVGRLWITGVTLFYWIASTPATASALIRLLTPDYPPVETRAQARGAAAVVVLGAGMDLYVSRGDEFAASVREDALRMMEASRVYHVLDRPFVVVTGGNGSERYSEAGRMAAELEAMGVPADRIVEEARATNTFDHARYVPPLLQARHVGQFVLVTSRQHIDRALRVFRKAGFDPVPSSPELGLNPVGLHRLGRVQTFLPSRMALLASEELVHDKLGLVYYWLRGWI